jgi:hypothetical protein
MWRIFDGIQYAISVYELYELRITEDPTTETKVSRILISILFCLLFASNVSNELRVTSRGGALG